MIRIEEWPLDKAEELAEIWAVATSGAANCYPVAPRFFSRGLLVDETDDESLASGKDQHLLVATDNQTVLGFAHLCTGAAELDGQNVDCGILRFLAFPPTRGDVGEALLAASESRLSDLAKSFVDAFPLYHGYAFHNHKVGILSDKLDHIVDLLTSRGYSPHGGHVTLSRELEGVDPVTLPSGIDIAVEKTEGNGKYPDIRIRALSGENRIGHCRSMSGFRYSETEDMQTLSYTRHLAVNEAFRRRGIGRYLLARALEEMKSEGYDRTALNCRQANRGALALYADLGYETLDTSAAYFKDLDE